MNKLHAGIFHVFFAIILQSTCWSQDSVLMEKNELGRYMNVSPTNFEIRAIEVGPDHIRMESLGSADRTYRIIERERNVIKTQYEDLIMFFELKRGRILFYQRITTEGNSIESYRKGEHRIKNVFRKVNLKRY